MGDESGRHDESLPLSLELRIDAVCRSFEAAWKAAGSGGTRPRIEDYLATASDAERWPLLHELLKLELHYRRRESPCLEDYGKRFPAYAAWLAPLFQQLSSADREWTAAHERGSGKTVPAAESDQGTNEPTLGSAEGGPAGGKATPPTTNLPSIPGYDLLGELGRGGMGVVYRARHLRLKRVVALKMLLTGLHGGPEHLGRFRTEAEAVARLQHPHIVSIFEVGDHQGLPYLALEYVDGGSLAQRLPGFPLPPLRAAELMAQLAAAVQHAHECGVIHRDLKPANVLLTTDGTPKITDFGLAKLLDAATGHTASGAILGTPSYMAPEQAGGRGGQVGPPADVYALGAILYELLTGRPPFQANTTLDTLLQVISEEAEPPSRLRPDCPPGLEAICLKCLQKQREQRYSSAEALAEDLQRFLAGRPVRAPRRDPGSTAAHEPGGPARPECRVLALPQPPHVVANDPGTQPGQSATGRRLVAGVVISLVALAVVGGIGYVAQQAYKTLAFSSTPPTPHGVVQPVSSSSTTNSGSSGGQASDTRSARGQTAPPIMTSRSQGRQNDKNKALVLAAPPDLVVYQHLPSPTARVAAQVDPELDDQFARGQMRIAIVFDRSFIMSEKIGRDQDRPNPRLLEATAALQEVLSRLPAGPQVSLWTFGHRQFRNNDHPEEQLQPLQRWTPDQADRLVEQVLDVRFITWDCPLVHTMMKAAEKDLGLGRAEEDAGPKLLLVLTGYGDNVFGLDREYNPSGKVQIPDFLKEHFDNSDIRVIVIGFKRMEWQDGVQRQFGGLWLLKRPGQLILTEDRTVSVPAHLIVQGLGAQGVAPGAPPLGPMMQSLVAAKLAQSDAFTLRTVLTRALQGALRAPSIPGLGEPRLRLERVAPARADLHEVKISEDQEGGLPVGRVGEVLIPSSPLPPDSYLARVPLLSAQPTRLGAGDLLLFEVRPSGLARALFREYDQRRRTDRGGRPLPGGRSQDWLVTAHRHHLVPPDRESLRMMLSVEKDSAPTPPDDILGQVKPRFVWFEVDAGTGKEAPRGVRWYNVGDVLGYPAPAWQLDVQAWPKGGLAHVHTWVCETDPGVNGNLSHRLSHNRGESMANMVWRPDVEVGTDRVSGLRVTLETMDVEARPCGPDDPWEGEMRKVPCLVVRLSHPPNRPVLAQIDGLPVNAEHRFYSGANFYTGVFWPVPPALAEDCPFALSLTSLRAVQDDRRTYRIDFDVPPADRELQFPPPERWGPAEEAK
jgi:serine/threonine-protein kinase